MSKGREQSAIDAIYELLEEVKDIRKELKIIDNNIKLLNNKVNKLSGKQGPTASVPTAAVPPSNMSSGQPSASPGPSEHTIKLFGRLKNQRKKPIKGVYIKVYDAQGNIIKSRESDIKGYWEARVPPGKYVVELNAKHIIKKSIPMNINVELNETMNEYEVK